MLCLNAKMATRPSLFLTEWLQRVLAQALDTGVKTTVYTVPQRNNRYSAWECRRLPETGGISKSCFLVAGEMAESDKSAEKAWETPVQTPTTHVKTQSWWLSW